MEKLENNMFVKRIIAKRYLHKQHTPNPDAHTPEMLPPKLEQSDEL